MNWDLSKLYTGFDAPEFESDLIAFRVLADELFDRVKSMPVTANDLEAVNMHLKDLTDLQIRTMSYAQLTLAADANCTPAMAVMARLMPVANRVKQISSALSARLGATEDLDRLIAGSQVLEEHAWLLRTLQRDAAHVIDPELEPAVLKMQLTGGSAWQQLRDQLEGTHTVAYTLDEETQILPLSTVRGMAYSPDSEVRRAAYEAELAAYPKLAVPMAACLNAIKGEARTMAELRHFDSVLDMSLYASHMDRTTLDALLTAMRESLPMFRRYFRLKARMLGYEGGLRFYDLFAPVGDMDCSYTPQTAREILVRELGAFSPRMGRMIERAFDEHWIDMYPREGKAGGAFCAGVHPLGISYVLTNFDGNYSSVSTLAHELGHAYHDACMNDVSVLLSTYPMPLAETASIFNETLLAERMLKTAGRSARIALLEQQLSDAAQVIVDIMSRYIFETEVIRRREDSLLSADDLCDIMLDAQRETYGDGLDPDCMHPYMWACKSHYYSIDDHFYNFPYAFGQLFAVGVYRLYERKGAAFLPEYEKLLRAAGNGDVRTAAASVGIDVSDVDFWRGSLRFFEEKLRALEALV
ncbi:MAG: M3 family oligoendopeptidase [Clostridia bacterium]|nr:M3 family oligoendopeptidase [Clostridia bacterium]